MCTYTTEQTAITGSGKGAAGWFGLRTATVYYDHPVHAQAEHTLNIDFADPSRGPAARVAVELTARSALDLVDAIHAALAAVPPELLGRPELLGPPDLPVPPGLPVPPELLTLAELPAPAASLASAS